MTEPLRPPEGDAVSAGQVAGRALFVLTILAGSFLLFLVQPMVARMALPRLGGAPAVWNSAMLVYQALLLGGYAYAHALGRLRPRAQGMVHVAVLLVAALWLPIGLMASELPASVQPALWAPWLLLGSIGPLFFAVSAQAPLVQRWFSVASGGRDPYALYAASNLGSFAGLIAYPLLVEPLMPVRVQSLSWSGGYLVLAALIVACVATLPRSTDRMEAEVAVSPAPTRRTVQWWLALSFVPSGLMLATSTYITTDIVAMPLLWVLPLGLYLLSFSIAFAERRAAADFITRIAPITILLFGGVMMGGYQEGPWFTLIVALALLFVASVALHTAMYRRRPAPDRLTGFYLAMAAGGALGGVFAGLVAPVVFDWTYEYPLLILAAGALAPQTFLTAGLRNLWWARRTTATIVVGVLLAALLIAGGAALAPGGVDRRGIFFLVVGAIGLASVGVRVAYMAVLATALMLFGGYRSLALSAEPGARTRSYFGVYTVRIGPRLRELDHGTTVHGIQLAGTVARERTPTTYYAPGSGVGQAMQALPQLYGPRARVGVVGLGTGTLACYARPGQTWRFYEIDPAVVRIARDTGQFTYLSRCLPNPSIVMGDARVSLARAPAGSLDMLALDAFSSDAVPMHLMTREAFATYARVVGRRGLLLVHISNRFLDLEPVVAAAAQEGGWAATLLDYKPSTLDATASHSMWIALSPDAAVLAELTRGSKEWRGPQTRPGIAAWTDDYSTILPLLKRP
ncbi:spermidine synthase [Sphingomonas sp. 1P08PE]|uniref:spermidine synthase n=1 Tax=Sphingomonas sp. 1P08PE TaxID=554122 RepID=UPI0039A34F8D